jgi:hypothetical protein
LQAAITPLDIKYQAEADWMSSQQLEAPRCDVLALNGGPGNFNKVCARRTRLMTHMTYVIHVK